MGNTGSGDGDFNNFTLVLEEGISEGEGGREGGTWGDVTSVTGRSLGGRVCWRECWGYWILIVSSSSFIPNSNCAVKTLGLVYFVIIMMRIY